MGCSLNTVVGKFYTALFPEISERLNALFLYDFLYMAQVLLM